MKICNPRKKKKKKKKYIFVLGGGGGDISPQILILYSNVFLLCQVRYSDTNLASP